MSAAIQQQGVAAALGDAFAEDVVFLGARTNTIQGRAGAVYWLTSNPLAPSAIVWSVLVADVSSDGTQGYTWTTGAFTADFGPIRPALIILSALLTVASAGAYLVAWSRHMSKHGEGGPDAG